MNKMLWDKSYSMSLLDKNIFLSIAVFENDFDVFVARFFRIDNNLHENFKRRYTEI